MPVSIDAMAVATVFTILGAVLGVALMLACVMLVPRMLNMLTPNIDEEKEIAKGNQAVAHYFGGIVSAIIIGMSIIIGAAIIAGIQG